MLNYFNLNKRSRRKSNPDKNSLSDCESQDRVVRIPALLSEPTEIWRTCEYLFTVEVEGNDYDYSFSQCTIKECIHPDWKCPCDDVSNLGEQQSVVR